MPNVLDWDHIKWPLRAVATPSSSSGRWVIKDSTDEQVVVFYDVPPKTAISIVQSLNSLHTSMATTDSEAGVEFPSWPAFMGKHPRFGAQWTEAERNQLYVWWQKGVPMQQICKALGRDQNGVGAKLMERYGDRSMEYFGSDSKKRKMKDLANQLTKLLAEMAKVAAS